jgi:hypothetical protein
VFNETKFILQYCREHASDLNPVQDLVDKLKITWAWFDGETCMTVKQFHDAFLRNEISKVNQTAHAFTTDRDEEIAQQYCIDHASDILQGKNPVSDLMRAGLISGFEGKTCSDVNAMILENDMQKSHRDLLCEMVGGC